MVYVSVDYVIVRKGGLVLELSVAGFRPSGCAGAMGFLAGVFKGMAFDYACCEEELRVLGRHVSELSKDKVYVGAAPPGGAEQGCIFVDGDSPHFDHAYTVYCIHDAEDSLCVVKGANLHNGTTFSIVAEFHERPRRETRSCRHSVEAVEHYARSEYIHIGVCPAPKYLEQRRRLKLVEQALVMASLTRGAAGPRPRGDPAPPEAQPSH
jgi:hypothetical protein